VKPAEADAGGRSRFNFNHEQSRICGVAWAGKTGRRSPRTCLPRGFGRQIQRKDAETQRISPL